MIQNCKFPPPECFIFCSFLFKGACCPLGPPAIDFGVGKKERILSNFGTSQLTCRTDERLMIKGDYIRKKNTENGKWEN